ncbi:hypothetical protein ABZV93_19070 [Actinopolymorpha sp. NPDC004070]|uniref:CysS/YqeB C-terminal domain-containing protein n=1 Tax=Actinopolymorpha sp. NPDC004070 TaxID=3154548 RepID=UPI00339EEF2B
MLDTCVFTRRTCRPRHTPTLRARRRALAENDDTDAEQLRTELGRLGVVVRDEHKRQQWRRTRPISGPHT